MAESSRKKRTGASSAVKKKKAAASKPRAKRKTAAKSPAKRKKVSVSGIVSGIPSKDTLIEGLKNLIAPAAQNIPSEKRFELPQGYGDNKIVLMVRDPQWLFAYWEIPNWKFDELRSLMGNDNFNSSKKILRVHDVTDIIFTGMNANKSFDIDLSLDAKNWYINTGEPGRGYCVDIGYVDPAGSFYLAARSNVVSTPRDSMSDVIDEEWMTFDWDKMYALSGGFGIGHSSGEIREMLKKRLREEMASGSVVKKSK